MNYIGQGDMFMNIQKVQPNQTKFGTKVYMAQETKNLILKSNAKRKFLRHISKLENNGNEDVFVLTHEVNPDMKLITNLKGIVYEKRGNDIFKTPYGYTDALTMSVLDRVRDVIFDQHANILGLYEASKYKCIMRKMDTDSYKKMLSNLTTI